MQNPFTAHQNYESKPKRNAFDNSHRCYMTGKLGCLYPVLTLEVNAGDSVQIDSEFLFNFFPFVFPVQTPLKASIYFFYGRNRIFWKNWMDFAYNNKQPSHPFILQPNGTFWETGSLADFLGVPTTYSTLGSTETFDIMKVSRLVYNPELGLDVPRLVPVFCGNTLPIIIGSSSVWTSLNFRDLLPQKPDDEHRWLFFYDYLITKDNYTEKIFFDNLPDSWNEELSTVVSSSYGKIFIVVDQPGSSNDGVFVGMTLNTLSDYTQIDPNSEIFYDRLNQNHSLKDLLAPTFEVNPTCRFRIGFALHPHSVETFYPEQFADPFEPIQESQSAYSLHIDTGEARTVDLSGLGANPFSGTSDNLPQIPLNAIPFRFYEALYNAYFRNERNDPFIVNGEIEYNKWNTTLEDGADSTPYKLYYRNWEADFLTTATQTPQQGLAPLVGINVRGDMEFLNEDGTISRIRPTIDDDGHTITGIAGVVENGTKEALRSAMELITSGISINDFRQVSSLQSWLENNLRKGLKYKDQVAANTGVKIRFDELDMPEFIGGFSRPVTMTSITQATPSTADDNALGDRAGQASVYGGSKHKISHYCDEAGYIMAVMCVYPTPVYTQLLPKYFLKSDALSYYHPQFGSIGLQPISYREVCPVQVFQESGDLDATFGYQRPWYDLIANVDQAHGNMRTNMKQYLMHRTFAGIPQLGRDFLKIDPKQLNDVFTITDDTEDVFQGQIAFNIFTKRAIPRFGIPRQI